VPSETDPSYTMPRIQYIIAIAAGKGGVGKSTVTAHLARSLADSGYSVGIMDADIYGPSIPHMLHCEGKPALNEASQMIPHFSGGIYSNSMGYLIGTHTAASWRGPMASKALFQLFFQTAWPPLDYLLIDMPPGTGDIQLSLASKIPVSCAVLVTTPQIIARLDVQKAADLFAKVRIPVIGIIENMSYLEDAPPGKRRYLFGQDGGKALAAELNTPLIGQIPIDPSLTEASDAGHIVFHPAFTGITRFITEQLTTSNSHAR